MIYTIHKLYNTSAKYNNFQQNRVYRSVIFVHTHLFVTNCKLHKFATTNSNFLKIRLFQTCIIVKRTCISSFSKNRVSRSVKTMHTTKFAKKIANCINFHLAVRISKNHAFRTCTTP